MNDSDLKFDKTNSVMKSATSKMLGKIDALGISGVENADISKVNRLDLDVKFDENLMEINREENFFAVSNGLFSDVLGINLEEDVNYDNFPMDNPNNFIDEDINNISKKDITSTEYKQDSKEEMERFKQLLEEIPVNLPFKLVEKEKSEHRSINKNFEYDRELALDSDRISTSTTSTNPSKLKGQFLIKDLIHFQEKEDMNNINKIIVSKNTFGPGFNFLENFIHKDFLDINELEENIEQKDKTILEDQSNINKTDQKSEKFLYDSSAKQLGRPSIDSIKFLNNLSMNEVFSDTAQKGNVNRTNLELSNNFQVIEEQTDFNLQTLTNNLLTTLNIPNTKLDFEDINNMNYLENFNEPVYEEQTDIEVNNIKINNVVTDFLK